MPDYVLSCDGCGKGIAHAPIGSGPLPLCCSRCRGAFFHDGCEKAHSEQHRAACDRLVARGGRRLIIADAPLLLGTSARTADCGICLLLLGPDARAIGPCGHRFCGLCADAQASCPQCRFAAASPVVGPNVDAAALVDDARLLMHRAAARRPPGRDDDDSLVPRACLAACCGRESEPDAPSRHALREYAQALERVSMVLARLPAHRGALLLKSRLLAATRQPRRAIDHTHVFVQTTDMTGASGGVEAQQAAEYALIAGCHMDLEEWGDAAEYLRKAWGKLGDGHDDLLGRVYRALAACYSHLGRAALAEAMADAAAKLDRHAPGAYDHAYRAHEADGDAAAALPWLQRAVAYEAPWCDEARTRQQSRLAQLLARQAQTKGDAPAGHLPPESPAEAKLAEALLNM
ncbi:hypothetical protein M885DRAFT_514680 [Pelagophyceae sp. CCMP2097]|nr:hypothetical protein M885DRAFT_514680 [Pelagophyceae sp. CCMP2097]